MTHDGGRTIVASQVGRCPEPRSESGGVAAALQNVQYELTPRVRGVEQQLHDGVLWRCVAPCGDAVVQLPGTTLRGRGYAEVLELSVAPWTLPIRELRWGRALGQHTSLAWIQWTGAKPLQLAVRDGVVVDAVHIGDDQVRLADGTHVTIARQATLREDSLANTLRPLRAIAPLLPRIFTETVERKWLGRATIEAPGRPKDDGSVIHELLTFPAD